MEDIKKLILETWKKEKDEVDTYQKILKQHIIKLKAIENMAEDNGVELPKGETEL
jgi:butyrate kinase